MFHMNPVSAVKSELFTKYKIFLILQAQYSNVESLEAQALPHF